MKTLCIPVTLVIKSGQELTYDGRKWTFVGEHPDGGAMDPGGTIVCQSGTTTLYFPVNRIPEAILSGHITFPEFTEEDPMFAEMMQEAIKGVGEMAKAEAFAKGQPIVYEKDGVVVWEYPDGRIEEYKPS